MDLFAAQPQPIVTDAEGGIRYFPDVVDPATADAWFAALRDGVRWKLQDRPMYDRVVAIPRLLASFPLASAPPGLPLAEMLAAVHRHVDAPFNAVGMNLYRDGADSVAMHGDKLHTIVAPHPIALLSLGATRRMLVKAKAPGARAVGVDLAPGVFAFTRIRRVAPHPIALVSLGATIVCSLSPCIATLSAPSR